MYLDVVMDLSSRQITGWAMCPTMTSDLALQALLAAVCVEESPTPAR